MVLRLNGTNSETSLEGRRYLCYSICLRQLLRSGVVTNNFFFQRREIFTFMRAQHVLSYHGIRISKLLDTDPV